MHIHFVALHFVALHLVALHLVATSSLTGCTRGCSPDASSSSSAAPAGSGPVPAGETTLVELEIDGSQRRYFVHVPKGAGAAPPAIMVLHGGGGHAEGAQRTSFTPEAADRHGFVAIYPEGVVKTVLNKRMATWNGGYCCGLAAEKKVDDVAFLAAVLDDVAKRTKIDASRVYVTGISNGGIMAVRFACERPDLVAGVSSVGSPGYVDDCADPKPVPVQIVHGTDDACARYEGGDACGGCWERAFGKWLGIDLPGRSFACASVADQAAFWRRVNGCGEDTKTTYDKGDAQCVAYQECTSGKPVEVCTIEGGGHTWPGGELGCDESKRGCRAYVEVTGVTSEDLDANDNMVRFFSAR